MDLKLVLYFVVWQLVRSSALAEIGAGSDLERYGLQKRSPDAKERYYTFSIDLFFRTVEGLRPDSPDFFHWSIHVNPGQGHKWKGISFDISNAMQVQRPGEKELYQNIERKFHLQRKDDVSSIKSIRFATSVIIGHSVSKVSVDTIQKALLKVPVPERCDGGNCVTWSLQAIRELQERNILPRFETGKLWDKVVQFGHARSRFLDSLTSQARYKKMSREIGRFVPKKDAIVRAVVAPPSEKPSHFTQPGSSRSGGNKGRFRLIRRIWNSLCKREASSCAQPRARAAEEIAVTKMKYLAKRFGLKKTPRYREPVLKTFRKFSEKILLKPRSPSGVVGNMVSAGSGALNVAGLAFWGVAMKEVFDPESGSTAYDKLAVSTSLVPFVGCATSDIRKIDVSVRGKGPTDDVAVTLSVIDSTLCYVIGVLYFTPLAPVAAAYTAVRMMIDLVLGWVPQNADTAPGEVAEMRWKGWEDVLHNISSTIMSENYTFNLENIYRHQKLGVLSVAANAAGNLEAEAQLQVLSGTDDQQQAVEDEAETQGIVIAQQTCDAIMKHRDNLHHTMMRFFGTKLHNAASRYDDELYEALRLKSKWPWEGLRTPTLNRLSQEQKDFPLVSAESSRQLSRNVSSWLDGILGKIEDPIPGCEQLHEPSLYTLDGKCRDPCGPAARKMESNGGQAALDYAHTSEGQGIWGCVRFHEGRRLGAISPVCCEHEAFSLMGFGLADRFGGQFIGHRCVEFEREKSALYDQYQFMDKPESADGGDDSTDDDSTDDDSTDDGAAAGADSPTSLPSTNSGLSRLNLNSTVTSGPSDDDSTDDGASARADSPTSPPSGLSRANSNTTGTSGPSEVNSKTTRTSELSKANSNTTGTLGLSRENRNTTDTPGLSKASRNTTETSGLSRSTTGTSRVSKASWNTTGTLGLSRAIRNTTGTSGLSTANWNTTETWGLSRAN
ncbi:Heat Labile Enterotoxin Type Iib [Ophiocordyceps camponoti-floridani]|uniref:Heat Labile Enterotoxin Type Iib n=1 Tax=Ophiocordyceps camponoti-floridani TaxID=2030778 RepID=A0A8H4VBU2_9HYPO|nr:Heat Labile Enterotoxin Type Iib [Ophiocordyceps camponoti-floridani]